MGMNVVEKIFSEHIAHGGLQPGGTIGLRVDEVITQDATGTMAWLQFEAIGIERIKIPLAVSFVDHNMLQSNFMNADDHAFLESSAARFGAWFSRPGNGISHQINLERFAKPGAICLGTDSHTPTGGGAGMISIGVGGLEAATVMAGSSFELKMPDVVLVRLKGKMRKPWVSAMDVILELLRRLTVKGGVGKIMEYGGTGVAGLSVTERATITNMGAELGATTSVFPSDKKTKEFLKAQGRQSDWREIIADKDAKYSQVIDLDLSKLEPMIAQPHSPDNVVPVKKLKGLKVNQVCIGSCTNSSYQAMRQAASILDKRTVAEGVNLLVNPGSKQVYEMLAKEGHTAKMIASGARMLESSCGPCIGMGGTPGTDQVSVRSYNRNFKGRSGNQNANVYLASAVTCALLAIEGKMVDPLKSKIKIPSFPETKKYLINDNMLVPPKKKTSGVNIVKGPNIKEVPVKSAPGASIEAKVILKLGDNVTTDDIMPAGSSVLPLRSNIPAISEYVFVGVDKEFAKKAKEMKEFIVIGGENYGQGSSREHAALAPMYLGLQAVIAVSFARIHRSNLINFGVLPLTFKHKDDYAKISQGDELLIKDIQTGLSGTFVIEDKTKGFTFEALGNLNQREAELLKAGGLLPFTRKQAEG